MWGYGLYVAAKRMQDKARREKRSVDLSMPDYTSTSILLSEARERKKAKNRMGRSQTNVTNGLNGNPSLGLAGLWGY